MGWACSNEFLIGNDQISEDGTCPHVDQQRLVVEAALVVQSVALVCVESGGEGLEVVWEVEQGLEVAQGALGTVEAVVVALGLLPQQVFSFSTLPSTLPAVQCSKAVHVNNHWPVHTNLPNSRGDQ